MKNILVVVVVLLVVISTASFAIDIPMISNARLDIVSRTSFGIDLDRPYRYGFSNELTKFDLVFGLTPYQQIDNRLTTPDAVGFISITLFHLNLIKTSSAIGYSPPGSISTNRFQTGEFLAGIAIGPWLIQLNAAGNEPFTAPWNKGMEYINDGFKFSWAYLDSMVDVRRVTSISGIPVITRRGEENLGVDGQTGDHDTMLQFDYHGAGFGSLFVPDLGSSQMVAVMYNSDDFGINFKLGTQHPFNSHLITENNPNGIAMGVDTVFMPDPLPGLKIFASVLGAFNWDSENITPVFAGTRLGYIIPLNEDISLEPWLGFDIGSRILDGGFRNPMYEASIGATMRWPGHGGWYTDYILNSDGRVFPGMSLGYKVYQDLNSNSGMEHSIKFTLFEPRGDDGVFYTFGSEIIIDLIDLTSSTPDGFRVLATAYFDAELSGTMIPGMGRVPGTFVPWVIIYYDNLPGAAEGDSRINDMKIDLGINLVNAIQNTTFGIVWNSGSLIQQTRHHWGYLRFTVEISL